tara:strand:+ start:4578 stop:4835 length:258 start_codon:yes stop_codon:yes gene_type:complete
LCHPIGKLKRFDSFPFADYVRVEFFALNDDEVVLSTTICPASSARVASRWLRKIVLAVSSIITVSNNFHASQRTKPARLKSRLSH